MCLPLWQVDSLPLSHQGNLCISYSSVKEAHLESLTLLRLLRGLIEFKHKDKAVRTIPGM